MGQCFVQQRDLPCGLPHILYNAHTMPPLMDYSHPSDFQLVPQFLRPQRTIPEPPTPPHKAHALGVSKYGHLFALQVQHYLEEKSRIEWGCHDASQALTRPPAPGLQREWLYADGSSRESGHAAAITAFLPDGTTRVLFFFFEAWRSPAEKTHSLLTLRGSSKDGRYVHFPMFYIKP